MAVFLVVKVLDLSGGQSTVINYPPLDVPAGLVKAGFDGAPPSAINPALDGKKKPLKGIFETAIPAGASSIVVSVSGTGKTVTIGGTEYWPVTQKLKLNSTPTPNLAFDGAQEINVRNLDNHTRGSDFTVEVHVVMGQLRDITALVTGVRGLDFNPHPFQVIHLGTPVLKSSGTPPDLFDGTFHNTIPTGTIFVALRTTTPRLIAIYRPDIFATALYPKDTPVAYHMFLHPNIPWDDAYPDSFPYVEFIQRYMLIRKVTVPDKNNNPILGPDGNPLLVDVGKHMIYSHADAGDRMIFVYPIGSKKEGMGNLKTQSASVRLLEEVNYWIQRMDSMSYPLAPVGRLSLSFFSAGVRFANAILAGPKNALFFDTLLKEVYSFDGIFESVVLGKDGKPVLVTGKDGKKHKKFEESKTETTAFCNTLKGWYRSGSDTRAIRIYNQSRLWFDQLKNADPTATVVNGPENAAESEGNSSSVLFVPVDKFWKAIVPNMDGAVVHQLIPDRFMVHALDRSKAVAPTPPPPPTPPPVTVTIDTPSPLTDALKDQVYAATLHATGGTPPFDWKITAGALPTGLSLSGSGEIAGTPRVTENVTFTVVAKDSTGVKGTKDFAMRVVPRLNCFIIGAAYGSQLAPEVQFLWDLRENVLRQTEWGRSFFARYWNHYYRISPPIAEEMKRDPELRDTVRWSIVEPWTNYMKLLLARPDWDQVDFDALPATVRDFLLPMRQNMDAWLENIPLPRQFAGRDPLEAVQELNVALTFVRRTGGMKYLDELCERGELPLRYDEQQKPEITRMLREAGRSEREMALILGEDTGENAK